jgi:hypothetical protein
MAVAPDHHACSTDRTRISFTATRAGRVTVDTNGVGDVGALEHAPVTAATTPSVGVLMVVGYRRFPATTPGRLRP